MYSVYNKEKIMILKNITYKELIILIKDFKNDFKNEKLTYLKNKIKINLTE